MLGQAWTFQAVYSAEDMFDSQEASQLCDRINTIWDTDEALMELLRAASAKLRSRNAMIARINDEQGQLRLTHGVGADWESALKGAVVPIGVHRGQGVIAFVAAEGKPFLSGDVTEEPVYRSYVENTQSELAVPVRDRTGRIRAVVNVESDQPNHFKEADIADVAFIGSLVANVIARDELLRREQALFKIGHAVDRAQNESELLEQLLQIASQQLHFQSCAVFLFDPERRAYVLRAATGLRSQVDVGTYQAGDGMTGWVCKHGKIVRMENPQSDPRWKGRLLEIPKEDVSGYLGVPIFYRGESYGAIRVLRRRPENPHHDNRFSEDDERILCAIAEQITTGLERIRTMRRVVRVERMAAWGELSAKSSHMIGNRAFALRGDVNELGHLLDDKDLNRNELKDIHTSLVTNLTRLEEILQEFRDFVTATQLTTARAGLNFLVREAVDEVFPRRSQVELIYDLSEEELEIMVDARKLRRAITEIVENSLSFFEKGRLRVTTHLANSATVRRARLPVDQKYAEIIIEDEGPGIEPERKHLIFQPFYSSRVKGMGLGLSIVKGILEAHGGEVMEEGRVGKGARFVMLIPLHHRQ
ncbi:MAG: GAF domain-containing protein [Armatimonadetes bacterium]|nr:GAF domain-containing protein [Armatimonadota bacterium]